MGDRLVPEVVQMLKQLHILPEQQQAELARAVAERLSEYAAAVESQQRKQRQAKQKHQHQKNQVSQTDRDRPVADLPPKTSDNQDGSPAFMTTANSPVNRDRDDRLFSSSR